MRSLKIPYSHIFGTLLLVLISSFSCFAGEEINSVDANGKRQGYWKISGAMSLEDGYRDDQIVEEGHYESDKKIGVWKKYYPTGILRNEITYKNNIPRGPYKIYYPNGNLEEEGTWLGNKNVEAFKRYHENGKIAQDFTFTMAGKRNGVQNYYYPNGNLQLSVEVKEGVAHGFYKTFYPDGNPKVSKNIIEGKVEESSVQEFKAVKEYTKVDIPVVPERIEETSASKTAEIERFDKSGENKLYNHRKQVTQAGEFKDGRLWNGKWYKYDANGNLKKVEVYQEGRFAGYGLLEDANK
jgi:antitoxin component YwqK of YwqJK toxin-antitoxin module